VGYWGLSRKKIVYTIQITTSSFAVATLFQCSGYFPSFVPIYPKTLSEVSPIKHVHFRAMKMKVCSYMDAAIFVLCGVGQILFG